ncbi:MAG: DUF2279 domain-containing protein [Chitinophagaceae bacterium]|nr:MAG: DUF2279 domain-containing protein [Chitinophagaceae bacterium]
MAMNCVYQSVNSRINKFYSLIFFTLVLLNPGKQLSAQIDSSSGRNDSVALMIMNKVPNTTIRVHEPRPVNQARLWSVGAAHTIAWTGTFVALNNAWYRDYPKSSFHFFDDRKEWNQMDKAGHVWTAYQLSRISTEAWYWTGLSRRKSAWLGGASAFAFQSVIEILDGFSAEWGFSVGDMEANLIGSAGYMAQELLFQNQVFQFKLGYRPYNYPDNLKSRRDNLFGSSVSEQLLKDYNSQRYWLSGNIKSMFPDWNVPGWLNIAVGYSADGMYGGHVNNWTDKQGNSFDYTHIKRTRRFYLAPDIDLTKIKTNSKLLKTVFFVVNSVKIPAPTVEINNSGKMVFRAVMF